MNIPDELLTAYVDGGLEAAERERIEQAIAHDARLAQRVAQQRARRDRLRGAFDDVLREPVPQRLLRAVRIAAPVGPAQIIDLARVRAERTRRGGSHRALVSRRFALAASLLVGVGVGLLLQRFSTSGALTEMHDGTLLARGALLRALDEQPAGAPPAGAAVRIGFTFKAKSGGYCRTFLINAHSPLAGLACREQQQWQLPALVEAGSAGGPGQNLRTASAALPAALLQAVNERISGEPMDAQGDAGAREHDWR